MDNNFICTRCGGLLTMKEYRDNVCLCDGCWAYARKEFEKNDVVWYGFNNVDEILEIKRLKQLKENNNG